MATAQSIPRFRKTQSIKAAMSLTDTPILAISFYLISAQSCQALKSDLPTCLGNRSNNNPLSRDPGEVTGLEIMSS